MTSTVTNAPISTNATPIIIERDQSAQTTSVLQGQAVLMVAPTGNQQVKARFQAGADVKQQILPEGTFFPWLTSQDWAGNNIKVTNTGVSGDGELKAGVFNISGNPTKNISNNPQTISLYQSIGGRTATSEQQLNLEATNTGTTLVAYYIGAGELNVVALSTNEKAFPPYYNTLSNKSFYATQQASLSINGFGQTIFVFNLSIAPENKVKVNLV